MNQELFQENLTTEYSEFSPSELFAKAISKGFACAFYRLPHESSVNIIIDTSGALNIEEVKVEGGDSGFVFHPFSKEIHSIKFLRKDIHLIASSNLKKTRVIYSNVPEVGLWELLAEHGDIGKVVEKLHNSEKSEQPGNAKDEYISIVKRAIESIEDDKFQKVIIARKKDIPLEPDFDPLALFQNLCNSYESSFAYLTYIPETGVWCGATPELLLEKDSHGNFRTVALAATQEKNDAVPLSDATWTQKDIEEQAMVSRYVINCFKRIRLREFDEIGPRSCAIGNLIHLKTDFIVDTNQVQFPDLCSEMLDLLHPTSAVCGMPKEEATQFILDNEGFDREYFTGYLGPVNVRDESHIFVNLRCMKLANSHAELFAGAGILSNSNPEKEWHETEIKMDTVLNELQKL